MDRTSAAQILETLAPPWCERAALSASLLSGQPPASLARLELVGLDQTVPGGAPPADVILVAPGDAPADARGYVALLDRLAPGGRAIFPDANAGLRELLRTLQSLDLQLYASGPAKRLAGRGLNGRLTVLSRPVNAAGLRGDGEQRRLSVLLPQPERRPGRLAAWRDFFTTNRFSDQCELLAVTEGDDRALAAMHEEGGRMERDGALRLLRHWRPRGAGTAAQTALLFSRGESLLLDDASPLPCEEAFALLDRLWRETPPDAKPDGRIRAVRAVAVASDRASGKRLGSPRPGRMLATTAHSVAGARLLERARRADQEYFTEWLQILSRGRGRAYDVFVRAASQ